MAMIDAGAPTPRPRVAVLAQPSAAEGPVTRREQALAAQLGIPIVADPPEADPPFDLLLAFRGDRLELRSLGPRNLSPIGVDFLTGATAQRIRWHHFGKQPLAVAIGMRQGCQIVVDATAGLGNDAFMLAAFGCTVTAVERCGVLAALLSDGLVRASADGGAETRAIVEKITLVRADARAFLGGLSPAEAPDTIFLDPMFAPRRKSVAVNKMMRITRMLAGDDGDAPELLGIARRVARKRVVVKRHRLAPPLAADVAGEHAGKTVRYDVYVPIGA